MKMNKIFIALLLCSLSIMPSHAAKIIFQGSANGVSVHGTVTYDENATGAVYDVGSGLWAQYLDDVFLSFTTPIVSSGGSAIADLHDARPGNSAGRTDSIGFSVIGFHSGFESYGISIDYPTANTLTDTSLPAIIPQGPAYFFYRFPQLPFQQPRQFFIPVSFQMADVVPENSTWLMMISGIGMVGWSLRRRRYRTHLIPKT